MPKLKPDEVPGPAPHWGAGVPRYRTKGSNQKVLRWNNTAMRELKSGNIEDGSTWHKPGFYPVFPSLMDPFDNEVPDEWRADLWKLIKETPYLTWLLLTKRIGNAAKMIPTEFFGEDLPFMPSAWRNVWLGASIVNQEEADRDIPKLLATPAAKRFISYEPALSAVDFRSLDVGDGITLDALQGVHSGPADAMLARRPPHFHSLGQRIHWVIVGGESAQGGAKARPFDLRWAADTVKQCKAAGVACFVKQLGSNCYEEVDGAPMSTVPREIAIKLNDPAGSAPAEWPEDLRVQEFPTG